ncbi:MAG: nitric oxide synthase oxygenase [Alphaproteobacteria bacterium]
MTDRASEPEIVREALAGLFSPGQSAAVTELVATSTVETLAEGDLLMSEGADADDLFILCDGRLQVYVRDQNGFLEPVSRIDQAGIVVGEQSFIEERQFRNATLIALRASRIARVPGALFRRLLESDKAAALRLSQAGDRQLEQRLNALALEIKGLIGKRLVKRQLRAGETLFTAGETASHAFLIVAGSVALIHPETGRTMEQIGKGLSIGVAEARSGAMHQLTASATIPTELIRLDAEHLAQMPAENGFQDYIFSPGKFAPAGRKDHVVLTSLTAVEGEACVTSDYVREAGSSLRVKFYPSRNHVDALIADIDPAATKQIPTPSKEAVVLLDPDSGRVVGVSAVTGWAELRVVMDLLISNQSLSPLQQEALARIGQVLVEAEGSTATGLQGMICACKAVTALQLEDIARETGSLDEMIRQTGAGTVCGGCRDMLPLFLRTGKEALGRLEPARVTADVIRATLHFRPDPNFPTPQVGQYARISAMKNGQWVSRPYTLTDWAEDRFEIMVKLEDRGQFSDWLRQALLGDLVKIGEPEGQVHDAPGDSRPLVFVVAGIGVTPALAAVRKHRGDRPLHVSFVYRDEAEAPGLDELRAAAAARDTIHLHEFATTDARSKPVRRPTPPEMLAPAIALPASQIVICGPSGFNASLRSAAEEIEGAEVWVEDFHEVIGRRKRDANSTSIRLPDFVPDRPRETLFTRKRPGPKQAEADDFLTQYFRAERPGEDPRARIEQAWDEMAETGRWTKTAAELGYAAQLAWRNAPRCIGRLYWRGLHLRDHRGLKTADEVAGALFEHMRFAFNGGAIKSAISVFDPGTEARPGPRIWNPQLQLYAGYTINRGQQFGDPAQNALTAKIMDLGWTPKGGDFEVLPLVIQTADEGPRLFELPEDCVREVALTHPGYPRFTGMNLRWHAVPYVTELKLDAGGVDYPLAPFNGWFMNTEIAARNLTDLNRYDLLASIAQAMDLEVGDERSLWRDKALIRLNEAVLGSFDREGVRMTDHHTASMDFIEFCKLEQRDGREPFGEWMWLVPPVSSSLSPLYQQPIRNLVVKPAYVPQPRVW